MKRIKENEIPVPNKKIKIDLEYYRELIQESINILTDNKKISIKQCWEFKIINFLNDILSQNILMKDQSFNFEKTRY
jgi:hypothetical protein